MCFTLSKPSKVSLLLPTSDPHHYFRDARIRREEKSLHINARLPFNYANIDHGTHCPTMILLQAHVHSIQVDVLKCSLILLSTLQDNAQHSSSVKDQGQCDFNVAAYLEYIQ